MPSLELPFCYLLARANNSPFVQRRRAPYHVHPDGWSLATRWLVQQSETFGLLARFGFPRSRVNVSRVEFASEPFARFLLYLVLVSFQLLCLLARVDFDRNASRFVLASFLASGRCLGHGSSKNVHLVEQ